MPEIVAEESIGTNQYRLLIDGNEIGTYAPTTGLVFTVPTRLRGSQNTDPANGFGGVSVAADQSVVFGFTAPNPNYSVSGGTVLNNPGAFLTFDAENTMTGGDNVTVTFVMRENGANNANRTVEILKWTRCSPDLPEDNPNGSVQGALDIGVGTEVARYHEGGHYAHEVVGLRIMAQGPPDGSGPDGMSAKARRLNTMFLLGGAHGAEFYSAYYNRQGSAIKHAVRGESGATGVGMVPQSMLSVMQYAGDDEASGLQMYSQVQANKRSALYMDSDGRATLQTTILGVRTAYSQLSNNPGESINKVIGATAHAGALQSWGVDGDGIVSVIERDGSYRIRGNKVLGGRLAAVNNVTSPTPTTLSEVISCVSELKQQFNTAVQRLRDHGLIES